MTKDCKILFKNKTTYDFAFSNLPIALRTIKERGWEVLAINTPVGVITLLDSDEYRKIMSAFAEDV